jgi:hypothetical protein
MTVTYCDVFGRMPPLLCNRKLDTPVVAMQEYASNVISAETDRKCILVMRRRLFSHIMLNVRLVQWRASFSNRKMARRKTSTV